MNIKRHLRRVALLAGLVAIAACSSEAPPAETASDMPAASKSMASGPRVFFVEPKDGATVKSPVHLVFGIENFALAAVPEGTVESARPAMGHHHVGVDIDCLPPGSEIPKANPWVHHGGAQTEMDMQLTPGPHKLTLQLGDDLHHTIDGLCSTVNITVAE